MARKNIYEIIHTSKINVAAMYNRVLTLYAKEEIIIHYQKYTIETCIEESFRSFSEDFKKGTISLEDFNDTFGLWFEEEDCESADDFLTFCEYVYNLTTQLLESIEGLEEMAKLEKQSQLLFSSIHKALEDLGHMLITKENFSICVPKSLPAEAVAEIVDENLSYTVLEYNHFRLKGNLTAKLSILKLMADDIEPHRKVLDSIDNNLSKLLFQMLNKFVRHNTTDNVFLNSITDEDREYWYDEIYQMWLLAKLELDNVDRKRRVKEVLSIING